MPLSPRSNRASNSGEGVLGPSAIPHPERGSNPGAFFRVVNGAERKGFERDPIVQYLGGPETVRAARRRLREEVCIQYYNSILYHTMLCFTTLYHSIL